MDMKKHFETATEKFEFTVLNVWGRKKGYGHEKAFRDSNRKI